MDFLVWLLSLASILNPSEIGGPITVSGAPTTNTTIATTALVPDPCANYKSPLLRAELPSREPFGIFREWHNFANDCGVGGSRMTLATADKEGVPSVRSVVLVGDVIDGFKFYTHYDSLKGRDIEDNPVASVVFYWPHKPFDRQVRITGNVTRLPSLQSDVYWRSVSQRYRTLNYLKQGHMIRSETIMETMRTETVGRYSHPDRTMQRPSTWGGYIIRPYVIEFAQGGANFMRDRIVLKKLSADELFDPVMMEKGADGWVIYRILP